MTKASAEPLHRIGLRILAADMLQGIVPGMDEEARHVLGIAGHLLIQASTISDEALLANSLKAEIWVERKEGNHGYEDE